MFLIVGLGNPGNQYAKTRHNLGQMALSHMPFFNELSWQTQFKGRVAQYQWNGKKVFFLIPLTYMNLSGEAVGPVSKFFKIPPANILILHDELDLPYGSIQFKMGGGIAGHNGLRSCQDHLGTLDFARLRLGIGRSPQIPVKDYVLRPFDSHELAHHSFYLDGIYQALEIYVKDGLNKAMTLFNKKNFLPEK
jgi:PTH1 family peptidyl-tRNA hydrolase